MTAFTPMEERLMTLLLEDPDRPRKGYAYRLGCCEKTVAHHFQHLYEKTETHSRAGLVAWAYQRLFRRAYGPWEETA